MGMREASIVTISDRCSRGEREDAAGPAVRGLLEGAGWEVAHMAVVPDDEDAIKAELIRHADELDVALVVVTGGTGLSPRDVTPEATLAVVHRRAPGIPEAMRAASLAITPRGCLSRAEAGVRGRTLIVDVPGSPKAATECLSAVIEALAHGVDMLRASGPTDCAPGSVVAVCISTEKGTAKHAVEAVELRAGHGIVGDAHAGPWHRQVSLLGVEDVEALRARVSVEIVPGAFAENVLTRGVALHELPIGARLRIGTALCEVTQIGKGCHEDCAIRRATGDCPMPRRGIFARVIESGVARPGDRVERVERG